MAASNSTGKKSLTVSYGTFSCTLEGFDNPLPVMKAIAEYFRDLAADDRHFGVLPQVPDGAALHRIAERELRQRVKAKLRDDGITFSHSGEAAAGEEPEGGAATVSGIFSPAMEEPDPELEAYEADLEPDDPSPALTLMARAVWASGPADTTEINAVAPPVGDAEVAAVSGGEPSAGTGEGEAVKVKATQPDAGSQARTVDVALLPEAEAETEAEASFDDEIAELEADGDGGDPADATAAGADDVAADVAEDAPADVPADVPEDAPGVPDLTDETEAAAGSAPLDGGDEGPGLAAQAVTDGAEEALAIDADETDISTPADAGEGSLEAWGADQFADQVAGTEPDAEATTEAAAPRLDDARSEDAAKTADAVGSDAPDAEAGADEAPENLSDRADAPGASGAPDQAGPAEQAEQAEPPEDQVMTMDADTSLGQRPQSATDTVAAPAEVRTETNSVAMRLLRIREAAAEAVRGQESQAAPAGESADDGTGAESPAAASEAGMETPGGDVDGALESALIAVTAEVSQDREAGYRSAPETAAEPPAEAFVARDDGQETRPADEPVSGDPGFARPADPGFGHSLSETETETESETETATETDPATESDSAEAASAEPDREPDAKTQEELDAALLEVTETAANEAQSVPQARTGTNDNVIQIGPRSVVASDEKLGPSRLVRIGLRMIGLKWIDPEPGSAQGKGAPGGQNMRSADAGAGPERPAQLAESDESALSAIIDQLAGTAEPEAAAADAGDRQSDISGEGDDAAGETTADAAMAELLAAEPDRSTGPDADAGDEAAAAGEAEAVMAAAAAQTAEAAGGVGVGGVGGTGDFAPAATAEPGPAEDAEAMRSDDATDAAIQAILALTGAEAKQAPSALRASLIADRQQPEDAPVPEMPAFDEAALMAQIAALRDIVTTPPPRPAAEAGSPGLPEPRKPAAMTPDDTEAAVSRLLDRANSKLEDLENRRRQAAISHLKAAVAATLADNILNPGAAAATQDDTEDLDRYRDDLSKAVGGDRPGRATVPHSDLADALPLEAVADGTGDNAETAATDDTGPAAAFGSDEVLSAATAELALSLAEAELDLTFAESAADTAPNARPVAEDRAAIAEAQPALPEAANDGQDAGLAGEPLDGAPQTETATGDDKSVPVEAVGSPPAGPQAELDATDAADAADAAKMAEAESATQAALSVPGDPGQAGAGSGGGSEEATEEGLAQEAADDALAAEAADEPHAAMANEGFAPREADEGLATVAVDDGFADFAERLGAQTTADLMEAAAAYAIRVEGLPHFALPHVMAKVNAALAQREGGREDALRAFGTLLRRGTIRKVRRGRFAVDGRSRFLG